MGDQITHRLVRALRDVPDFSGLEETALVNAVGAAATLRWREGSVVFDAGDAADAVFVVLHGKVRISEDGDEVVADIGAGDYFGEQAVLLHTTHSARATAVEDCELLAIPKAEFESLLESDPELAARFRRKLERRLSEREGRSL